MTKDQIIAKIKKCLKLGASANEHESANALKQAKLLMEKYNIDHADIVLSDVGETGSRLNQKSNIPMYLSILANSIAETMGCRNFLSVNGVGSANMIFVGVSPNDELASYAFDTLSRKLRSARKEYAAGELRYVRLKSNKTRRADNFCLGWCFSVKQAVSQLKVSPPEIVGQYMKSYYPKLSNYKPRKTKIGNNSTDAKDINNGGDAGKGVSLNRPLNRGEVTRRLGN